MNPQTTYISKSFIDEALLTPPVPGKHELEVFKNFTGTHGVPVNILEDENVVNPGEVHEHEADLWICISGEVTFTCGGVLEGETIIGGEEYVLTAGDILHIPATVPHAHRSNGNARLFIIKIPLVSTP